MLYDCRRNKLIIGKTLWSPEELKANVHDQPTPSTKTEILRNDSISEKTHALKVDGLLKLDVLCNNVDVEGAASYLTEEKGSKRQARVVLKYEAKTQFRRLTMEHLDDTKISYHEVLEEDNATHVVVGVQYGGNVFVEFVQEVTEEECSKRVQGEMKAAVEKLKGVVSSRGNVNANSTTQSTQKTEKIKCQIYSDFPTDDQYPSTYEEAVEFCKRLPSLTGSEKIGVPVVLHLCPLDSLGTLQKKRRKTRKEISAVLINKACATIEHLQSVLAECKDLIQEDNFPTLKYQLTLFMEKVQKYKIFFQEKVSQLTFEIRDGSANTDKFGAFLKGQEASVFSHSTLDKWLSQKREKVKMLREIMKSLKGTPFVSSGELDGRLCDPKVRHVVCLAFRIFLDQDFQLLNLEAFLNNDPTTKSDEIALPLDISLVREPLKRFMNLSEDNVRNNSVKFVAMEEPLSSLDTRWVCCKIIMFFYETSITFGESRNLMCC